MTASRRKRGNMQQPLSTSLEIPAADLPLWMRQARRHTDWGLLLVLVLSLGVVWSFLTHPGIAASSASINHAFMASDIADTLREGRLYSRWSPHVFSGYGAPIPNYYPPGAAYSVAIAEVLFTNDTLIALRLVYSLAPLIAGSMIYLLVSRWSGAPGGILAALLYVFSPYVGLVAPAVLGDLPGVLVLALLPLLLWGVNRLLTFNQPLDFMWVALSSAALLLTRPTGLLAGAALALILIVLHLFTGQHRWRVPVTIIAMLIGVGLAAMYWLPALLEVDLVRWLKPSIAAINYSLTLPDLLTPLRQPAAGELAPPPQFTLGSLLPIFALFGLVGAGRYYRQHFHELAFLVAGIALAVGAVMFAPYETSLTGIITLCLAIGSSAALALRQNLPPFWQRLTMIAAVALVMMGSLSVWLPPASEQHTPQFTPIDQLRYEQQALDPAVLTPGSYIPTTLPQVIDRNRNLITSYQGVLEKIAPAQLTRTGQLSILSQETHGARYQIQTDQITRLSCRNNQPSATNCRRIAPMTISWLTAYFPGWQAWFNDLQLQPIRNNQTGLIELRLPGTQNSTSGAGEAELIITLGATPIRNAAWGISWLAAFALAGSIWIRLRRGGPQQFYDDRQLLTPPESRLMLALLLCFGVVFYLTVPADAPVRLQTQPDWQNLTRYNVQTEVGLQLFGYQIENRPYHPGETLSVSIFWRAQRPLRENYRVSLYLEDVNRLIKRVEQPLRDPGGLATRRWTTAGYVEDRYELKLPDDIFAGNYRVTLEVLSCESMATCNRTNRLTFFEQSDSARAGIAEKTLQLPILITIARS